MMNKKTNFLAGFFKSLASNSFFISFLYLLSSATFFLIVLNRKPNFLRPLSLLVQFRPYLALPLLAVALYFAFAIRPEKLRKVVLFFFVASLFALSLAGVWANTQTENYMLAGLIPNSDASYQYAGALRLLDFGELNGTASRRPFFAEFMALLLALTGRSLLLAIAIVVFLAAVAAWQAVLEIESPFGRIPAILFVCLAFLYYARFAGTFMTENLGFICGLLSLAALLASFRLISVNRQKAEKAFIFGVSLFSLGQNVRPGAVLMIPLLLLLSALIYKGENKAFNWKIALTASLAGLLPFLVNQLHFALNGAEGSMPMGNMAYGLYGFVRGGLKWNQIIFDHPDILDLPVNQQTRQMFIYIFQEVTRHPLNLLKGFGVEFQTLFDINSQAGLLSFLQMDSRLPNSVFSMLVIALYGLGLIRLFIKGLPLQRWLVGAVLAGFILSLPLAPASQTQYMRVYAGSLPFMLLIPIYGLDLILPKTRFNLSSAQDSGNPSHGNHLFSALLAAAVCLSPLALMVLDTRPPALQSDCPAGQAASLVYFNPSSAINIMEDSQVSLDWVPDIHQARFRTKVHNICCEDDIAFFESLSAPVTIFTSLEKNSGNAKYFVIVDTRLLPAQPGWLHLCGTVSDIYGKPAAQGFFYPQKIVPNK